jgi:alpha-N-arabinofuranosidase
MEELVSRHVAIMDKYDPDKKTALVVDEWGGWYDVEKGTNPGFLFQQNTMRDAMLAAVTLNIFNNHCDRVRMANLAQMVNVLQAVILTNKEKLILTPTYHVMEMYNVHQDAMMIPIELQNIFYKEGNDSLPSISVSASRNQQGLTHISLVNIDPARTNTVHIQMEDPQLTLDGGRILQSADIQDFNDVGKPGKIEPRPFSGVVVKEKEWLISLPAASVVVLTLH